MLGTGTEGTIGDLLGGGNSEDLMLISTKVANASAALIWTGLTATYETLLLDIKDMIPGTGAQSLFLQVSEDNGVTWKASGYHYAGLIIQDTDVALAAPTVSTSATAMLLSGPETIASSPLSTSAQITIRGVGLSSVYKMINSIGAGAQSGPHWQHFQFAGGYVSDAGVINAIKLFFGSGNISSGTASLYGLKA